MIDFATEAHESTNESPADGAEQIAAAAAEQVRDISINNMLGELMAISLDAVKQAPAAWHLMTEDQQERMIDRVQSRTRQAVREAVYLISAQGFVRVPATLEQVVAKDGLKAVVIPAAHGSQKYALLDAVGQSITLVLANPDQFTDAPHGHKAEPQQPQLALDGTAIAGDADAAALAQAFADDAPPAPPPVKGKKRRLTAACDALADATPFREFPSNESAADYLRYEAQTPEPLRCIVAGAIVDVFRDGTAASIPLPGAPVDADEFADIS